MSNLHAPSAVLDSAHIGDIRGAFGTIRHDDIAPRNSRWHRLKTLGGRSSAVQASTKVRWVRTY